MKQHSLLDRIARPDGNMRFIGGFWTTHDYCGFTVADSLAPRLARCKAPGTQAARRLARTKPETGKLLILASHIASHTVGPVLPPWIHVETVQGRRLHAKFGVLAFSDGDTTVYRGFVMSANLTRSGMLRNREVAVVEERRSPKGKGLPYQLVTAFRALLGSLPDEQRADIDELLAELNLPKPAPEPLRDVVHTLDAPRDLLAATFEGFQARFCEIVSPPFGADNSSRPAECLARYLAPDATTYIVTGRPVGQHPSFSRGALATLEAGERTVEPWLVREQVEVDDKVLHRRLHAKVVALIEADRARCLIGSANFSTSGLGLSGTANRELCVRVDFSDPQDFWKWEEQLDPEHFRGKLAPGPNDGSYDGESDKPVLEAAFRCGSGQTGAQSSFGGDLILAWDDDPLPGSLWYGEDPVEPRSEQPFTLREDLGSLYWEHPTAGPLTVPIAFRPPDGDAEFWTRAQPKVPDPARDAFVAWLDQFRRPNRAAAEATASTPHVRGAALGPDDRYQVRLAQPLIHLARHREVLTQLTTAQAQALLHHLQHYVGAEHDAVDHPIDGPELTVAAAVVAGGAPAYDAPMSDPLLGALTDWVAACQEEHA